MEDNILKTIKKLIGGSVEDNSFDLDLLIHINTVFAILNRIGYAPENKFICDEKSKWSDYLTGSEDLEMIKTYIYLKVKMIFDPPTSSVYAEAIKNNIAELETSISLLVSI